MGENSWVNNDLSIEKKSLETLFAPICSARPLLLLGLLFREHQKQRRGKQSFSTE